MSLEDLRRVIFEEFRNILLRDIRIVVREELLNFLERFIEEEELSEDEMKEIKKALEEYKRGEYVPWKELKKELLR